MRLLFDARSLLWTPFTGVGRCLLETLRPMLAQHPEVEFFGFYNAAGKVQEPPLEAPNLRWVNRGWPNRLLNGLTILGTAPRLDRALGGWSRPASLGASLLWLPNINYVQWSAHVPAVLTLHDLAFLRYPELYNVKWQLWHRLVRPRLLARRAAAVVVPSVATAEDAVSLLGVPQAKVHVVPWGATQPQPSQLPSGLPTRYLLYVGTIEPRKNVGAAVAAFEAIAAQPRFADVALVLVGPQGWRTGSVRRRVERSPYRGRIRLLGYVDDGQRAALYGAASALVWPSWYEGFGLPIVEAFSCGCPVVTSATSALLEVAGDAALLVRPYDVAGLATALEQVLTDAELRQTLVERGHERVRAFSWERTAQQMWEVFERV